MRRLLLPAVAAALLLTTAACGSRPASTESGAMVPSVQASAAQRTTEALAAHDARFPDVALRCAAVTDATATPAPAPGSGDGPAPENPKHAENRAFKTTLALGAPARCRGEAHAARLMAALPRDGMAAGEASVRATAENLGYPRESVQLQLDYAPGLLALFVPGVGPCVTVHFGPKGSAEVHGVYMEGGCLEPKGGH
ncbi:hypothetical protein ACIA8O_31840 [Kitasatospora sp. NPDC051853]|uniref:hypothetical protein n=1 Tax=Kitasatospora sp. NPDC051853 TaxID=3364058 RepID=UPI0037BD590B